MPLGLGGPLVGLLPWLQLDGPLASQRLQLGTCLLLLREDGGCVAGSHLSAARVWGRLSISIATWTENVCRRDRSLRELYGCSTGQQAAGD